MEILPMPASNHGEPHVKKTERATFSKMSNAGYRITVHPLRNPVFDPRSREALALELTREWSGDLDDR